MQKLKDADADLPSLGRILDAAENEFARNGYAGASMKAIARGADVAQGLLHYHFGSKENLYEAVIARRAAAISKAREALLEKVDLSAPDALECIFQALYRPTFEEEGGRRAYAVIFNDKFVGERDGAYLVNKYYDPTAEKFINAMLVAEPEATREVASWAYILAIGALFTSIGRDGRQERLAHIPPRTPDASVDDIVRPLVLNAVGGLQRLAADLRRP